jgi:alkyl hydroperoxide reductase subunit AhpC
LGKTSKLIGDFARRNTKVIALSVDPINSHYEWVKDINETQQTEVTFPIIADADRSIATAYDMIHPNATEKFTVRSVFIIDPHHKVRLTLTYPASTGRNFYELLRVLDSLQLTEYEKVATPADWQHGEDVVILPSVSDEMARELFPQGFTTVKSYLRTTNLNK